VWGEINSGGRGRGGLWRSLSSVSSGSLRLPEWVEANQDEKLNWEREGTKKVKKRGLGEQTSRF